MPASANRTDEARQALGHRVRAERLRMGLSQVQLSTSAGVNRGFLSKVEAGGVGPSLDWLVKVADALGVAPQLLLQDIPAVTGSPGPA